MEKYAIGILATIYLVVIPVFYHQSFYVLNIIIMASIVSVISLGVWLTFRLGLMNIGQAAFCTIGGYTTALLSIKGGLSFWLCLPISGLTAAFVGVLIGIPVLRLRGTYFAMMTICLGEAVRLLFHNGGEFTGGPNGIWDIPMPGAITLGGLTLIPQFTATSRVPFYLLAGFLLICSLLIVWRVHNSRIGLIFRALSQSSPLCASVGIPVAKFRVIAFAICCFLGGIGGAFMASYMTTIYPESFNIHDSIWFNLYCFLGGLEYISGPILGAFIFTVAFESLRGLKDYQSIIYGILMIAFILWLPNGILSFRLRKKKNL